MFRGQLSFLGDLTKLLITSCSSRMSASAKELRHRGSLASLICPSYFILSHYLLPSLLPLCVYVCVCTHTLSHVQLFETPGTVACQAPLSMGSPRQEYWNGLPCAPPGDLPNSGIGPTSLASAGMLFTTSTAWEAPKYIY